MGCFGRQAIRNGSPCLSDMIANRIHAVQPYICTFPYTGLGFG